MCGCTRVVCCSFIDNMRRRGWEVYTTYSSTSSLASSSGVGGRSRLTWLAHDGGGYRITIYRDGLMERRMVVNAKF